MIYRGKVRGNVIVLPPGVRLPDGMDVLIESTQAMPAAGTKPGSTTQLRNGVPVFPKSQNGVISDLNLVNKLRDEAP